MNKKRNVHPTGGGRWLVVLSLFLYLYTPIITRTSCRPYKPDISHQTFSNETVYCLPSKGCTYLTEFNDCVRDNETPGCIYFNVKSLTCELCYSGTSIFEDEDQAKNIKANWTISDKNKSVPTPKLCEIG